ncbi:MAG: hypothetical protein AB2637_17845, partial [Candidatus Thiodiazotropha sp.]
NINRFDTVYTDSDTQSLAPANMVELIEADGSLLFNNQVDQLVTAMAAYDVPAGVGNVLPQEVSDELQPVLAENWQAIA